MDERDTWNGEYVHTMENSLIRYILLTYCQHVHIVVVAAAAVVIITKDRKARVSCLSLPFLIHINILAADNALLFCLYNSLDSLCCSCYTKNRHYTLALFADTPYSTPLN